VGGGPRGAGPGRWSDLTAGSGVAGGASVDFTVARYRADGSLDPTFSHDGRDTSDFVGFFDEVQDLAVDRDGRIVAGGRSCKFPGTSDELCDFGLACYTPRGNRIVTAGQTTGPGWSTGTRS
jgi:hypothetical protein